MRLRSFFFDAVKALSTTFFTTLLAGVALTDVAYANPADMSYSEQRILELHNAERAARGIPPLALDPRLQQVAREWAYKLAGEGTISHMATLPARGYGYRRAGRTSSTALPR